MATWNDYKNHSGEPNPEIGKDIDEAESISQSVGAVVEQRHNLNFSQRGLAELCGLPHFSVVRIDSGKSSPNLTTLLRTFGHPGLGLSVQSSTSPAK